MRGIEGDLVWAEEPPEQLDFIRAYPHSFFTEEDSEGRPDVSDDKTVYAWENMEYMDSEIGQDRYFFGLQPYDFGGGDLDSSYLKDAGCPPSAIDISVLQEEGRIEYIDVLSPELSDQGEFHKLKNIPEEVKSDSFVPDSIVFSDVREHGDCLEFVCVGEGTVELEVNESFSNCTLFLLSREFESVSLPDDIASFLAMSQL